MTHPVQYLLHNQIASRIQPISGVQAVVLGGSRARGTASPDSDIDLAIYYRPSQPLDLTALNRLATELDDDHRTNLLTPVGGWGPWINGGGWLKISGVAVDFLYRDLVKVDRVITHCLKGRVSVDYQPGHPHAFTSAIYLAEIAVCQPLADLYSTIAGLKKRVFPYPTQLRLTLIERFFWEAGFSIATARKAANRSDVAYVTGCAFRAIVCLLQTLFAANEQFWLNEKGALDLADRFTHVPLGLKKRVHAATAMLAPDPKNLNAALDILEDLTGDVKTLLDR
ncbi:MAG TPA: nucleotidyltransferase domain-containing protein [Levilinea sp.]|nr:nucleotidyltransferase domain-containing protein [Levilinea sp.]